MNRLKHSLSGFIRKMQISRTSLFIFIEGYKDSYVYSKIACSECNENNIIYEVVTGDKLPIDGSGKQAVLNFFDIIKRKRMLTNSFKGKTIVSIFFLDKDVDDFLRKKRRSEHIVYTEMYELENYLFKYGKINEAIAAAASLPINIINDEIGNYSTWRQNAAMAWKEWIKLCLFSHTKKIRSMCNYSQHMSPINDGVYGPIKEDEYQHLLSILEAESGLQRDKFIGSFFRLSQKVDKLYSEAQYDQIFKGKWYAYFLAEDIKKIAGQRRFNSQSLKNKIMANLATSLDFNDNWAEHFRAPLRRLLNEVEL